MVIKKKSVKSPKIETQGEHSFNDLVDGKYDDSKLYMRGKTLRSINSALEQNPHIYILPSHIGNDDYAETDSLYPAHGGDYIIATNEDAVKEYQKNYPEIKPWKITKSKNPRDLGNMSYGSRIGR